MTEHAEWGRLYQNIWVHRILPLFTCQSHSEPSRPSVLGFITHERAKWGMSDWRHLSNVQTEWGEEEREPLLQHDAKTRCSYSAYLKMGHVSNNSPVFCEYRTMQNGF